MLSDYLELRRSLGFKLVRDGQVLPGFVTFVEKSRPRRITNANAAAWATQPRGAPDYHAARLSIVRGFAEYVRARDPRHEVPRPDLLPHRSVRRVPYVYSDADVLAVMRAARELRGLRSHTYTTLIGLLACTGMRVGEAIALDSDDVDLADDVLTIRRGKFGKSREVALHLTTRDALKTYARARDRFFRGRSKADSFFVSHAGTRLIYNNVQLTFSRLLADAAVGDLSRRPRLHDLRHTFAVRTLTDWYRAKADIEKRLPVLSTYLGHVSPASTYWYLSTTPELMGLAAQRLERALGTLP
ncbi:MAG: tyrosine-type recombinase/integrase [Planctomycetes bacterium]|nr:tyrosine-type recombinase/integrase [Planctomycetota bacterium]MCO5168901.1 tyrosine-type recombinase/integrase [Planctomycetota bacterium]